MHGDNHDDDGDYDNDTSPTSSSGMHAKDRGNAASPAGLSPAMATVAKKVVDSKRNQRKVCEMWIFLHIVKFYHNYGKAARASRGVRR